MASHLCDAGIGANVVIFLANGTRDTDRTDHLVAGHDRHAAADQNDAWNLLQMGALLSQFLELERSLAAARIGAVLSHNVWVFGWRVIITLLGWLALLYGAFRFLFPQRVVASDKWLVANEGSLLGGGLVVVALGAVLTYCGYFV